jgi:nickel transport system ATP-binding protein
MLLELENITKSYTRPKGVFSKERHLVLKGVSLHIAEGECLGLIGESGSGKSTLGKLILGLEEPDSGFIRFCGDTDRSSFQKDLSVVFQDYTTSVNPRFRVEKILMEAFLKKSLSGRERYRKMVSLLNDVGLKESFLSRYPHELSGGQLQRVCIARALSTEPRLLVLDEAVSSLDAAVQMQILELLKKLKREYRLSYLFITHDLLTITYICDRILFFQEGRIVESVSEMEGLSRIENPYSRKLLLHV